MKIHFSILTLLLLTIHVDIAAQDIPLYSQKLTNSFVHNPSVAGNGKGSLTLSHRRFWSGVDDGSSSNLLSFHLPFSYDRFGAGINVFSEKVGIYDRNFYSGAFAYHIRFTDRNSLSMGVSAEFNTFKVNTGRLDVRDEGDQLLVGSDVSKSSTDFSFGLSYKSRFLETGLAINRLAKGVGINNETSQLSEFYSGYLRAPIPLQRDRHLIEPIVTFRQLSSESSQLDAGLYYTFRNMITLGGGYRTGGQYTATAAVRLANKILIGYSYESFNSGFSSNVGSSSEITLRIDFRDREFNTKTRNSRKIMSNSLAFRRKTLTQRGSQARSKARNTSSRLKKRLKRNYTKSPNYRMNSSRKLHSKRVKKVQTKRKKGRRKSFHKRKGKYKRRRR